MAHSYEALTFVAAMMAAMIAIGLFERTGVETIRSVAIRLAVAFLIGFVLLAVIAYVEPGLKVWRFGLSYALPLAFALIIVGRVLFLLLVGREAFARKIMMIGDDAAIDRMRSMARDIGLSPFRILGTIPIERASMRSNSDGWLMDQCRELGIDEIVVGARERRGRMPMQALLQCRMGGISVTDYHDFCERETGRVDLDRLSPSWLVFSDGFDRRRIENGAKRALDLVIACALIVLTSPLMFLAALAVKVEDGGPVFLRQIRVGRNGVPFGLYKFRSMRVDAERAGPQFAQERDPRITRTGRILRRTRIDELPQILNVLRGEMSFIGPRPERPVFVDQLAAVLPYFGERHRLRPGLSGWAQLHYHYTADVTDARVKLEYDLFYVKNWSFLLDLSIMAQTLRIIVWGNGVR